MVDTNLLPAFALVPSWPYADYAFADLICSLSGRTGRTLRTWQAQLPFTTLKSYTHVSLLSFIARRPFDALKAINQAKQQLQQKTSKQSH